MRTKTLLLTAALSAAGMATSMAQVYSVNAVGYVNTTLKPNFNLISNPLIAADNSIPALFGNSLPNNAQVYKFDGTAYTSYTYNAALKRFLPDASAVTIMPGEGVFVRNPGTTDVTITFVGEVPQGAASNQSVPAGLSIRSSTVPQDGTVSELGFPATNNDQIYQYDPVAQSYSSSTYNAALGRWLGNAATVPVKVGEAFFVRKTTASDWNRNFDVNS